MFSPLASIVSRRSAESPGAVAVREGEQTLTYSELEQRSAAVAAGLRERGIGEGDLVAICLPRSARNVVAILGTVRAGAAYVPLSAESPPERLRTLVELAAPVAAIGDPGTIAKLPPPVPLEVDSLASGDGAAPELPDHDRLAYVLFTSGSTGVPKGVEIGEAEMRHLLGTGSAMQPAPGDVCLSIAPTEFDLSALEIWGTLAAGGELVLVPPGRPDPSAVGTLIRERGITWAYPTAGFFGQLVRAALPDLGGMRLLATGGDVMPRAAAAALRQAHPGVRLINGYGPTETTITASEFEVEELGEGPVPLGGPLPGYEFHVLDEAGEEVAEGEPGELWIGGVGVSRGYRGDPERTADRFRPDRFSGRGRIYGSGDLVRRLPSGDLAFLGRADDQVKIAGFRVEPGEVSQVLGLHPGVRHAAVVAREDVAGHKRLVGYAEPADGVDLDPEELRRHLGERLPAYMVPAQIEVLAELPLTERGKVDRRALPQPRLEAGGEDAAAAGETAATVAALMAEVLGLERVGADDDYFHLGADSLLAIQLLGRLRERLGTGLDVGTVFTDPTPRRLAARIEAAAAGGGRPPLVASAQPGPAPATFAQRRAWLFERMNPDSSSFQFACLVHFEGELDPAALEGALADLVERHEVLRTELAERGGEPVQLVRERVETPFELVDLRGADESTWVRTVRERVMARISTAVAPMLRLTLVRRGERRWTLIDVEHHAVHDGWSFTVFLHELSELYSARVERRAPGLEPMRVQMGDFARWERQVLEGERRREQLDYWRRTLDPDPPLLELAPGRPRPARESFAGGSTRRRMDPELAKRLRGVAAASEVTFFQVCLAAFAVLLGRLGDAEEVQIGTGLANRRDPAAEALIGMTVETVALRVRLDDDPSVRELLRRVRETVLGALANSDVPFDAVVEELAPPRLSGRSPLIQTLFSFDDAPPRPVAWSGLEHRLVQTISNRTAKADLNVIGIDHGDADPFFIWEHSDLIDNADAARLADHHQRLLEQFAADPEAPISSLGLLDESAAAELGEWERGDGDYDREASIPDLVRRAAGRDPEATAVRGGGESLSYAELLESGARVAGALAAAGVAAGDRVGLLGERSPASVAAHLGVLLAGAAYVPLDSGQPPRRIAAALAEAGVSVALVGAEAASLPPQVRPLPIAAALAAEPAEPVAVGPEDLAYVMYTSGSTGSPKAVEVSHRNVVRLLDDPGFAELGAGTTMLHCAATAFDAATLEIWGPLLNGGTVVTLSERPHPEAIAEVIASEGVDTLWLTAGLFHELVDRRPDCLGRVRQLLAGGDVLSPDHVARALAALPAEARLVNGYGPTETTIFALTHELRPGDAVAGPVPLGRPVQGAVCEVRDGAGQPAPVGVAGELWIGGDGVARGYGNDPGLSAERFLDGPGGRRYRSGDRVYRDAGGLIHFLGRGDRQLKIRGFRVEPAEVEAVLRAHPGVADAAVVAREERGETILVAYMVAAVAAEGAELDPAELRRQAAMRLPAAMLPSAWVTMPRLPLTANGKLDRRLLPEPERHHLAASNGNGNGDSEPRSGHEGEVVAAFEAVLGVSPVGPEDDFFALGGHSLLAVELFARLEAISGRRLSLALVFEAPTPRGLAARIGEAGPGGGGWDPLVALKPEGSRPPLFVVSAGDGNIVGFGPLARRLSPEQPLFALQPSGLDGRHPLDAGIGAMAERYVEAIRAVRPQGPYLLAGRCNGAIVAYEMAQRLRRAGEEVPLLVSLDSDPPPGGPFEIRGIPFDQVMEVAMLRAAQAGSPAPDPAVPGGEERLLAWLREPLAPGVSRYLHEFSRTRPDLQAALPDPLGADARALGWWAWEEGVRDVDPRLLLPVACPACRPEPGTRWDITIETVWEGFGRTPADPLTAAGWAELSARLREPRGGGTNAYLLAAREARSDLRAAFPDPEGESAPALRDWAWEHGVEQGLAASLLPAPATPISPRRRAELVLRLAGERAERGRRRLPRTAASLRDGSRDRLANWLERRLDRRLPNARRRLEREVLAAARRARASYRAEAWPGAVTLITSREMAAKPSYELWRERALAGVEVLPLEADHVGMLREPDVALLAACLERLAARATSERANTAPAR